MKIISITKLLTSFSISFATFSSSVILPNMLRAESIRPSKPITVAVKKVKDRSGAPWFKPTWPDKLANVLSTELASTGHFTVLERDDDAMAELREELEMSGINKKTAAKKNNLNQAKYIILASVNDFEESDSSGGGGGFGFRGVKFGKKKSTQTFYISFDLKVVNTSTGTIAFSRSIEGSATAESKGEAISFSGASGASIEQSKAETKGINKTRVIRKAINEMAAYLDCVLYLKDECIEVYNAKDQKRKEANDSMDFF